MTLLELLRQELPKRGGWPKGANYIVQDGNDGMIKTSENLPTKYSPYGVWKTPLNGWGRCKGDIRDCEIVADDCATAIVTREQYEVMGWDGTGLPPVGVECEWLASGDHDWLPVTVLVYDGDGACLKPSDGSQSFFVGNVCGFRPLRTEAERAIDEMVRLSGVSIGAAKILYDAGYRK